MAIPKKVIPTLDLSPKKTLFERREQLLDYINEDGTYLPKSILHADLDRGFLDFVQDRLKITSEGKVVPVLNILLTTQNWAQFTQTWNFNDLDKNVQVPFISVVRESVVKRGTIPGLYTIPNRKQYFYAVVPTWDGTRKGMDLYTIPQPVPIDIEYSVYIMCNRMRELNSFNKVVMQTFSSAQAYTFVKGHYIPIVTKEATDESVLDLEKRKYYLQKYSFTLQGFLIDEEEFEVKPVISRAFTMFEVDTFKKKPKTKKFPENPDLFEIIITTTPDNTGIGYYTYNAPYRVNMSLNGSTNVSTFQVLVDNNVGVDTVTYNNPTKLELNPGDTAEFVITPMDSSQDVKLIFDSKLV